MKTKHFFNYLLFSALMLFAGLSYADIVNGDFQTGDLTGWDSQGNVYASNLGFNTSGAGFTAQLWAGLGQDIPTTLSQTLFLNAGDSITGLAKWIGFDSAPNNDYASITVNGTSVFSADIATYGDFGSSDVINFAFIAPIAGDYTLLASVANAGDNAFPSQLQVANIAIAAVPVPGSIWLFSSALLGLFASHRSKRV